MMRRTVRAIEEGRIEPHDLHIILTDADAFPAMRRWLIGEGLIPSSDPTSGPRTPQYTPQHRRANKVVEKIHFASTIGAKSANSLVYNASAARAVGIITRHSS